MLYGIKRHNEVFLFADAFRASKVNNLSPQQASGEI